MQEPLRFAGRLIVFGPMIYLGLRILLHPGWLAIVLTSAMEGIERFAGALRGHTGRPMIHPRRNAWTPWGLTALRCAGLVLTVYGVLCLWGLPRS